MKYQLNIKGYSQKEFELSFNNKVLAAIEEETGINPLANVVDYTSPKLVECVLYNAVKEGFIANGVRPEDILFTRDDLGRAMDSPIKTIEVANMLMTQIKLAFDYINKELGEDEAEEVKG